MFMTKNLLNAYNIQCRGGWVYLLGFSEKIK
jgi:hypothetical protein